VRELLASKNVKGQGARVVVNVTVRQEAVRQAVRRVVLWVAKQVVRQTAKLLGAARRAVRNPVPVSLLKPVLSAVRFAVNSNQNLTTVRVLLVLAKQAVQPPAQSVVPVPRLSMNVMCVPDPLS